MAEQRRDQAQQLVSYMLGDLAEQLRTVGNLKLLDSVGSRSLRYLEDLPSVGMQPTELVNHARALRTTGEVLMNQGKLDQAQAAFVRAAVIAGQAAQHAPDLLEARAETGQAAYWRGYLAYQRKQPAVARAHWSRYLAIAEGLQRTVPHDPRWQRELSYALTNLGSLAQNQGDAASAIPLFTRSIALKQQVLAAAPDDPSVRYELINGLSWRSSAQETQGLLADAEAGYREQIAMLRTLVAATPDADTWRRRLAASLLLASNLALARGQTVQAQADAQATVAILQPLVSLQPDNLQWQRDLAHAHAQIGWLAALDGRPAQGQRALQQARQRLAPLLQQGQTLPEWQWLDAVIALRLAYLQPAASAARAVALQAGIARLEALHRSRPQDPLGPTTLAHALVWQGEQHAAAGQTGLARQCWERALVVLGTDAGASHNKALLDPWIRAQIHLGRQAVVMQQLGWLYQAGYRHPGFVSFYAPLPKEQTSS